MLDAILSGKLGVECENPANPASGRHYRYIVLRLYLRTTPFRGNVNVLKCVQAKAEDELYCPKYYLGLAMDKGLRSGKITHADKFSQRTALMPIPWGFCINLTNASGFLINYGQRISVMGVK